MLIIQYPTSSVDISKLIKYYTDNHDVDEDLKTIGVVGGSWSHVSGVGIADRNMIDPPTNAHIAVASKK